MSDEEDQAEIVEVTFDSLLASVLRLGERKQNCRAETRVLLRVRKFLLSTTPSMTLEAAAKHDLMDGELLGFFIYVTLLAGRLRCVFVDPEQPKVACTFNPIVFCNYGLLCDKHKHSHLKLVRLFVSLYIDSQIHQVKSGASKCRGHAHTDSHDTHFSQLLRDLDSTRTLNYANNKKRERSPSPGGEQRRPKTPKRQLPPVKREVVSAVFTFTLKID